MLTTISSIKKPEVGEAIRNTFKGEWAHIQTSSRTTKANQVSTNMVQATQYPNSYFSSVLFIQKNKNFPPFCHIGTNWVSIWQSYFGFLRKDIYLVLPSKESQGQIIKDTGIEGQGGNGLDKTI